jgi:hypothetical protein
MMPGHEEPRPSAAIQSRILEQLLVKRVEPDCHQVKTRLECTNRPRSAVRRGAGVGQS